MGFATQPPEQLGNFLEGAFAPLAFLWLVIGYFLQQKELEQNTDALRTQAVEIQKTAEQAVIQSKNLAASEIHQRQEAFLKISDSVRAQLGSLAGLLYMSSQRSESGSVQDKQLAGLFAAQGSGYDLEAFSRRLLEVHISMDDPQEQFDFFYSTEVRARHTNNSIFTFERIMNRAASVDVDNLIKDAISASGHGFLYRILKRHQANAPEQWANHEKTGTHINF